MPLTVAVDIGGTFTDFLGYEANTGRLLSAKSSSTPGELALGIQRCLEKVHLSPRAIQTFVHGSTVAINTVVERKGAKTALVVTRGTRDVYKIGRGNRPEAYNIWFHRPEPLVPRHLIFEVDERLGAAGQVLIPFDHHQASAVADKLATTGAEAVAVCFLHSWRNSAHERLMGEILASTLPNRYITESHDILREYGEYERTSTTVLNAYIGPKVRAYLEDLERMLGDRGFQGSLLIMQSNGGVMAPSTARILPVATLESGPVGGFIAAARVGRRLGYENVIGFDMGGTTAKTSLIRDGEPQMASGYYIGGYATGHPMMLPVVDTVEVGSGGGSIARVDGLGSLQVGPFSAGAEPGPVCYGKGGTEPTITDANLILGRLDPREFLGGEMLLDSQAALRALHDRIARPLGLSDVEAALAIVQIAVMKMALAVRQVSVERGYDPRDFAMVAFGGAGPLHAVEVARTLHVPTIIVPNFPGQFSAAGMLIADLRHDYVRTYYKALDRADFGELRGLMDELDSLAQQRLRGEQAADSGIRLRHFFDVRYAGQDFSIPVPVEPNLFANTYAESVRSAFQEIHQRNFGYHDSRQPLEIVNARLAAIARRECQDLPGLSLAATEDTNVGVPDGRRACSAPTDEASLGDPGWGGSAFRRAGMTASEAQPLATRPVFFEAGRGAVDCAIYQRETLPPGAQLTGPAIILEYASTTVLFPDDRLEVAPTGELIVRVKEA